MRVAAVTHSWLLHARRRDQTTTICRDYFRIAVASERRLNVKPSKLQLIHLHAFTLFLLILSLSPYLYKQISYILSYMIKFRKIISLLKGPFCSSSFIRNCVFRAKHPSDSIHFIFTFSETGGLKRHRFFV